MSERMPIPEEVLTSMESEQIEDQELQEQGQQDLDRTRAMEKLTEKASVTKSPRARRALRLGVLMLGLLGGGEGLFSSPAEAKTVDARINMGLHSPEHETGEIPIHPDQRIEVAQSQLAELRREFDQLDEMERRMSVSEASGKAHHSTLQRLAETRARMASLAQMIAEKEALIESLSEEIYKEEAARINRLMQRAEKAYLKGKDEKGARLEHRASIQLFDTAIPSMAAYMASIGIREQGRTFCARDSFDRWQTFEMSPGFNPSGFFLDKRKDEFRMVFEGVDGSHYGFVFKHGHLVDHGPSDSRGER